MSLLWPHHIICGAPITTNYSFKIITNEFWLGDGFPYTLSLNIDTMITQWTQDGRFFLKPFRVETVENVKRWIDAYNGYHSQWLYRDGQYCRRISGSFTPCVMPNNMRRTTFYHILAQTPKMRKDAFTNLETGLLFYPRNRESKEECEYIISNLEADIRNMKSNE